MPELPGHTKLEKMRNMNEKLTLKQELIIIKERLWPKHLTTIGKIKHLWKKIVEPILNIDVFTFTGVFVGIILMFYLPYIQAMTIGILGFIVYLRIEQTMIAVASAKKK
jgi:hypothetical protein